MAPNRELHRELTDRTKSEKCLCGAPLAVAVDPAVYDYVLKCQACGPSPVTVPRHEPGLKQRYRRGLSLEAAGMTAIDAQMLAAVLRKEIGWAEARGERPNGLTMELLARLEQEVNANGNNSSRALAKVEPRQTAVEAFYSNDQVDVLRRQLMPAGISEAEFEYFLNVSAVRRLSPFAGQIHATVRTVWNPETKQREKKLVIVTGVDGFRLNAQRTGEYAGSDDPVYGPMVDDKFMDSGRRPEWCKVTVYRIVKGVRCPFTATVFWEEKVQAARGQGGVITGYTGQWPNAGRNQIAIRAEVAALRKGFAEEMAGFEHAEADEIAAITVDAPPDVDRATGEVMGGAPSPLDAEFAIEGEFTPIVQDPAPTAAPSDWDAKLDAFLTAANATRADADRFFASGFEGMTWSEMGDATREIALHDIKTAHQRRQQARSSSAAPAVS